MVRVIVLSCIKDYGYWCTVVIKGDSLFTEKITALVSQTMLSHPPVSG